MNEPSKTSNDRMCPACVGVTTHEPGCHLAPGPLWNPTAEIERMMKNVQASDLETMEVNRKVLEGLLYDSLLWRAERALMTIPASAVETSPQAETRASAALEMYEHLAVGVEACPNCPTCQRNAEETLKAYRDSAQKASGHSTVGRCTCIPALDPRGCKAQSCPVACSIRAVKGEVK